MIRSISERMLGMDAVTRGVAVGASTCTAS
jgi:hypothetical protein